MSQIKPTVSMQAALVNQLEGFFDYMNGLHAEHQIFNELPRLHAVAGPSVWKIRDTRTLPVYLARFHHFPVGLSYVQVGATIHILELWVWDGQTDVDIVLGTHMKEWKPKSSQPATIEQPSLKPARNRSTSKARK